MSDVNTYYTRSFSSFSGADIRATFAGVDIGSIQAISYAIQREKAPIYVLGKPNPRAFSRGKRGIAGTMIFVMFDEHALLGAMSDRSDILQFVKDNDEIGAAGLAEDASIQEGSAATPGETVNVFSSDYGVAEAYYVDQIPPFDVTVTGINETAAAAVLRIWGVEFLNEGYGISVDDMVSEIQTTYVCRAVTRWRRATPAENPFKSTRRGAGVAITGPRSEFS